MSGYTRLFSSILASSIWNESDDVRIIWITLLAMSDRNGHVDASIGGIAHQARKTRETTEQALVVLESPDPDSKNPSHEGRRIERLPNGGLMVLNYQCYRDGLLDDAETVAARERMRKWRGKQRNSNVTLRNTGVGAGDGDAIQEEVKEKPRTRKVQAYDALSFPLPALLANNKDFVDVWQKFVLMRKDMKCPLTEHACALAIAKCVKLGPALAIEMLCNSVMGGWQGLFAPGEGRRKGGGNAAPTSSRGNNQGQGWSVE